MRGRNARFYSIMEMEIVENRILPLHRQPFNFEISLHVIFVFMDYYTQFLYLEMFSQWNPQFERYFKIKKRC